MDREEADRISRAWVVDVKDISGEIRRKQDRKERRLGKQERGLKVQTELKQMAGET